MASSATPLYQKAIQLLTRREHSRGELLHKLQRYTDDQAEIESVVEQLANEGSQSDARFCEAYIRHRSNLGYGPSHIKMQLKQRSIDSELIQQYLYQDNIDWYGLAHQVRIKKFGEPIPKTFADKAKQMSFLQYRGFDSEQINHSLNP